MLNWRALHEDINLGQGDFIVSRVNPRGPLPAGASAEIVWDTTPTPTTWTGTVDGDTVSWREEKEDVADIDHGTPFTIWLHYPNAITETDDDYEWIIGRGVRDPRP
jgi:hypothetical protein